MYGGCNDVFNRCTTSEITNNWKFLRATPELPNTTFENTTKNNEI